MPTIRLTTFAFQTAFFTVVATASPAQPALPDAAACLARPTISCSVDLALTASANSHEDYERARLAIGASQRIKDLGARKAYLDRVARQFFADDKAQKHLAHDRRVADIAAALAAGDAGAADQRLAEVQDNFQRWWETLSAVIATLARDGKPDLAVAAETKYHREVKVSRSDALGRKLSEEVWTTRQPLALALVRCGCGPDPLPIVLALPKQTDRLGLAAVLYARRHAVGELVAFLTREFGTLAEVKDDTQRKWIGYATGRLLLDLPLPDLPAAVRAAPAWLTADHFEQPADFGMPSHGNIYGEALARAVGASDRIAVAALLKLRPKGEVVWLSEAPVTSLDAAGKVEDLLPKPERDHLHLLKIKFMLAQGDARKGLTEAMKLPAARAWRKPRLDGEDAAEFEGLVIAPLLARGALDVAEEAVRQLRAADVRNELGAQIAEAKKGVATKVPPAGDAAAALAAHWQAYRQSPTDTNAGKTFLLAVRDLIAAQPAALPFE